MDKQWKVYILRCGDGSLYTGVTTDVSARLEMHRSGRGAKYTRSRLPLELVYTEDCPDKVTAFQREWQIKHLTREEK
ncbi:MAG: GIY-YIG nuclease family protein [Oscillospiraceae bacterium]|nr:GIY-YIG nuclease family protein [Oscillospiraceae bacterium]